MTEPRITIDPSTLAAIAVAGKPSRMQEAQAIAHGAGVARQLANLLTDEELEILLPLVSRLAGAPPETKRRIRLAVSMIASALEAGGGT